MGLGLAYSCKHLKYPQNNIIKEIEFFYSVALYLIALTALLPVIVKLKAGLIRWVSAMLDNSFMHFRGLCY